MFRTRYQHSFRLKSPGIFHLRYEYALGLCLCPALFPARPYHVEPVADRERRRMDAVVPFLVDRHWAVELPVTVEGTLRFVLKHVDVMVVGIAVVSLEIHIPSSAYPVQFRRPYVLEAGIVSLPYSDRRRLSQAVGRCSRVYRQVALTRIRHGVVIRIPLLYRMRIAPLLKHQYRLVAPFSIRTRLASRHCHQYGKEQYDYVYVIVNFHCRSVLYSILQI